MATLQEVIDRACDLAGGAIDGPMQDADLLAQTLLPEVLHEVAIVSAHDPQLRTVLRQTHQITVTDSVGDLPDEALSAYLDSADVIDDNEDRATYSRYSTAVKHPDPRIAWIAMKEGTEFYYVPVGGGLYNGDVFVTIPTAPTIPALPSSQVVMPEEVVDDVIRNLAVKMVAAYKAVA